MNAFSVDLQQQGQHRYDGFQPVDFDLAAARSLVYVPLTGNVLHVLDIRGTVEVRFEKPNNPPVVLHTGSGIEAIRTVFTGVYISNAAQAGGHVQLAAGVNFDLVRQGGRPVRVVVENIAMTGAEIALPIAPGTVSIALHATGNTISIRGESGGHAWPLNDGEKESIDAPVTGTLYVEAPVGALLYTRRLVRL